MRVVSELRRFYPLTALLKLAGIPRSTFYSLLSRLDRPDRHATLREDIRGICAVHQGRYGYRRVTLDLKERGIIANHKLVMKVGNMMLS